MSLHAAAPSAVPRGQRGAGWRTTAVRRSGAAGDRGGGGREERASQLTYNLCRERKRKIPPPSPPPRRPFSPKRPLARTVFDDRPVSGWTNARCSLPTAAADRLTRTTNWFHARVRRIGRGSMPGKEGGRMEGPAPRVRDRRRRRREGLPAVAWQRAIERARQESCREKERRLFVHSFAFVRTTDRRQASPLRSLPLSF